MKKINSNHQDYYILMGLSQRQVGLKNEMKTNQDFRLVLMKKSKLEIIVKLIFKL